MSKVDRNVAPLQRDAYNGAFEQICVLGNEQTRKHGPNINDWEQPETAAERRMR